MHMPVQKLYRTVEQGVKAMVDIMNGVTHGVEVSVLVSNLSTVTKYMGKTLMLVSHKQSDAVPGQTSQRVSYRPKYDACRNLRVGLEMVTTLPLVVYTYTMCIELPTKS